jgi:lipopolysaccharide biosynthesis glycosyltransferase
MSNAIVSLYSGHDEGYLFGASALRQSLRGKIPDDCSTILLMEEESANDFSLNWMTQVGWEVIRVPSIRSQPCEFKAERWPYTFSKLHIHNLTQFDKVFYIDADCIAVGDFYERIFKTEPDPVAACWVTRNSPRFNAGVMLVRPDAKRFEDMHYKITTLPAEETHAAGSDQSFHNLYFEQKFVQLPDKYNQRHYTSHKIDVRIAHLRPHPWRTDKVAPPHQRKYVKMWWELLDKSIGSGRAQEIVKRVKGKETIGVEVGTYKGQTADSILKLCPNTKIHLIDVWDNSHYRNKQDRLYHAKKDEWNTAKEHAYKVKEKYNGRCHIHEQLSLVAVDNFEDQGIDWVFIDAEHSYESCKEDINAWLPKIKKGGWIGGHDYHPRWQGVMNAVREKFGVRNIRKGRDSTWFVNVNS